MGNVVGKVLGPDDGDKDGHPLGTELGIPVGTVLGDADGKSLGTVDGDRLGDDDGAALVLGAVLGAGLLLGTVLGKSVGHDSLVGVLAKSLQMLIWVTAEGPNSLTTSLDTRGTSITTCCCTGRGSDAEGSTTKVLVAPSASVA